MLLRHLAVALTLILLTPLGGAQDRKTDKARADYEQRAAALLLEGAQRHLDYGLDLRKRGLVVQATEQILLAVETSERKHYHANAVASLMRRYDDRFWKKRVDPSSKKLDSYQRKADKILGKNRKECLELAQWAWKKKLIPEARGQFNKLIGGTDKALEIDDKGRIVLDVGEIPAEFSERILADCVTINDRVYLRDAFLSNLPEIGQIYEHGSELLLLRCQTSAEDARALHALGEALIPYLERELHGRSSRRLSVFVFEKRATFEAYLDNVGMAEHRHVSGLADVARSTCLVCSEGHVESSVQAIMLHELAHLADHNVSKTRMPAWYREGLAEYFGGSGTFEWSQGELKIGGTMDAHRIEPLLLDEKRWSLDEIGEVEPLKLWASDREAALRFYAQSWALYRYMRHEAPKDVRDRFDDWVAMCGRMTGGGGGASGDASLNSQGLFERVFGGDLEEIEEAFVRWLHSL